MPITVMIFGDNEGFDLRCAERGRDMLAVLWDLEQEMRSCVKYDAPPHNKTYSYDVNDGIAAATEHWRERLWKLCGQHGVDLDDDCE